MFVDEIKDRLVAQGVGVFNTNIFIGSKATIPAGNGPFLSLIETGGTGSAKTQNNTATQRPSLQLVARGTFSGARGMIAAAYTALGGANGLWGVSLTGIQYVSIKARQEPTDIGLDSTGRIMYSFNIDAEKAPS